MTTSRSGSPRALVALVLAVLLSALLAACTDAGADDGARDRVDATGQEDEAEVPPVRVSDNLAGTRQAVPVDTTVRLTVENGTLTKVRARAGDGTPLKGSLRDDGGVWVARGRLEPGTQYVVRLVAADEAGETVRRTTRFRTVDLPLERQTYASIAPLDGETVGVGMPVIVSFDVPVTDKASIERHMQVNSTPTHVGSWHWISDTEARWRPKRYWRAGTDVTVDVDINSIPAGNGIFGQESRTIGFSVGDAVVHRVDADAHRMRTFINGELARTMPVSAGKAGFETRSGTKVIIEKHRYKTMDAATTGISEDDPEYYNIEDVEYAMRVTYSGEFLHAAPWSVGSQGSANVSHGCVGMSTADAAWVYGVSKRGDVVEVTGTERRMTLENGFGDWNLDFAEYRQGSAL